MTQLEYLRQGHPDDFPTCDPALFHGTPVVGEGTAGAGAGGQPQRPDGCA